MVSHSKTVRFLPHAFVRMSKKLSVQRLPRKIIHPVAIRRWIGPSRSLRMFGKGDFFPAFLMRVGRGLVKLGSNQFSHIRGQAVVVIAGRCLIYRQVNAAFQIGRKAPQVAAFSFCSVFHPQGNLVKPAPACCLLAFPSPSAMTSAGGFKPKHTWGDFAV